MKHQLLLAVTLCMFLTTVVAQTSNSKTAEEEFNSFDANKSGWLSGRELTACNCIGFDTNGDSEVTKEEYLAGKGGGKSVGSKVSFNAVDGKTYTGTITQIQGDKYKVKYDNVDFDAWLTADQFRVIQTAAPAPTITGRTNNNNVNPATQAKPQKQANTATPVSGPTGGKLYFRTMSWMNQYGTTLDLSWLFLGDNGMIVRNPKHGVNPINYQAEIADNADNVGKYSLANNKMNITWQNGKTNTWSVESSGGKFTAIDAGIVSPAPALPNNYRLSGQYAAGAFMRNVSSVQTLVFN